MDRRVVSLLWMLFFATVGSQAATLTFNPAHPRPTDPVEVMVINQGCSPFLETEITHPTASSNGKIRVDVVDVCDCIATPPLTPPLKAQIGRLQHGTYATEFRAVQRGAEGDLTCTGSTVIETGSLAVNLSGEVTKLRTEPPKPTAGQPVTVVIGTACPMSWKQPRVETQGGERILVIEHDPDGAVPALPCSVQNPFEARVTTAPLQAGLYRVRLFTGIVPTFDAETFLTVAPSEPSLLLQGDRFRVSATWDSPEFGSSAAQAVQLTRESGYFWFTNGDNVELVAKVLNGCGVNDHFWVFLAGLTNLEVTVTVEDTLTGDVQSYTNALGEPFLPVQDTEAFEGCELGDRR